MAWIALRGLLLIQRLLPEGQAALSHPRAREGRAWAPGRAASQTAGERSSTRAVVLGLSDADRLTGGVPSSTAVAFPTGKKEARDILRQCGHRGLLTIESIHEDGEGYGRIYALTNPKLTLDGKMKRRARTVFLDCRGSMPHAAGAYGWVVK